MTSVIFFPLTLEGHFLKGSPLEVGRATVNIQEDIKSAAALHVVRMISITPGKEPREIHHGS